MNIPSMRGKNTTRSLLAYPTPGRLLEFVLGVWSLVRRKQWNRHEDEAVQTFDLQITKLHHCGHQQDNAGYRMSLLVSSSSELLAVRHDVAAHSSRLQNLQAALEETLLVRCSAFDCACNSCLKARM